MHFAEFTKTSSLSYDMYATFNCQILILFSLEEVWFQHYLLQGSYIGRIYLHDIDNQAQH